MKIRHVSFITILLILLTTNCSNKVQSLDVDFETINVVKEDFYLNKNSDTVGTILVDISYVHPVSFKNEDELCRLSKIFNESFFNDSVNTDAQKAVTKYIEDFFEFFYQEMYEDALYNKNSFNRRNYESTFKNSVNVVNDSILSIKNKFRKSLGGPHGDFREIFLNVNLNNLNIITEDDIFIEGYREKLTEIIKTKLLETSFKNYRTEETTQEDIKRYFNDFDNIAPNGNFLISDYGIKYVYNTYEIASFAAGKFTVFIYNSEIKDILK